MGWRFKGTVTDLSRAGAKGYWTCDISRTNRRNTTIGKTNEGIESGVFELVDDFDTNTYRVIYTVNIGRSIYILHCFQKKSKRGVSTPKKEIDLIKRRLRRAKEVEKRL